MDLTFPYTARTPSGEIIAGDILAQDLESARLKLESLGLRIEVLTAPIGKPPAPLPASGGRKLRAEEFIAFNDQLAQLARAGMPIEQGLRWIADDLRRGPLARATRQVADDLEQGLSLPEAMERHRAQFPPLYGRLIDAGIRANNLPAILFNLGRHLQLVERLKSALWRALAYPIVLLVATGALLVFIGLFMLPRMQMVYKDFGVELPMTTSALLAISQNMPAILIALGVGLAVIVLLSMIPSIRHGPLPLIGPILRRNLIARWCDALGVGVEAGLDLPSAIEVAGDCVASAALIADGRRLVDTLTAGQPINTASGFRMLPSTVPAALQIGISSGDLAGTARSLSQLYQQQAEIRLVALPIILTQTLTLLLAIFIGFVIVAMFAPLIVLLRSMTNF